MSVEPVALQGRNERVNSGGNPRSQRGISDEKKSKGHGESPDNPGIQLPLPEEVKQGDTPGEKDKRFIHIR